MKHHLLTVLLLCALSAAVACASGPQKLSADPELDYLQQGAVVQLQYNLHPDEARRRLYNTNYQQTSLLPRCTPVTLVKLSDKLITFRLESGVEYTWIFDKHVHADRAKHFSQFFVLQCDDLSGLSEVDQQGIAMGQAIVGMSKQGVLYAMGLPPDHKTPHLDMDLWTYWRNKFVSTTVRFENGIVVEVDGLGGPTAHQAAPAAAPSVQSVEAGTSPQGLPTSVPVATANQNYFHAGAVLQLQYNLHPDEANRRLYNTNYQLPTLLPRCTPVTIVKLNKKAVTFRLDSGREYTWIFDKHVRADRATHFSQFFVPQCDDLSGLSEVDQQGIAMGQALPGMSKVGVLYAMGLPPDHRTPNLDMDLWTYWRNKVVTTTVHFENGVVVEVK